MEDLDEVKGEVWSKLVGLTLDELTEITTGLKLEVPEEKKDRRSEVYGILVKHLMSDAVEEAADGGAQIFKLVNTVMDQVRRVKLELQDGDGHGDGPASASITPSSGTDGVAATATTSVSGSMVSPISVGGSVSTSHSSITSGSGNAAPVESPVELATKLIASLSSARPQMSSTVQPSFSVQPSFPVRQSGGVQRLKDFKISGVVGGGEGQLDYAALMYRIKEGKAKGYPLTEIISGVVAAMKPGSELRRFFEITPDVSEEKFLMMLKSHYDIQSANKCLTELTGCVQEPTQGEREYIAKMLRLKNTLLVVAEEEEGFHMNAESIYQSFIDAVCVGLRNRATRIELQPHLEKKLKDEHLSWEVNKIVTRDEEHKRKMRGPKNASSNALEAEEVEHSGSHKPTMTKEDIIIAELRNLSSDVKELKTVKEDVQVIQKRMDGYDVKLEELTRKVDARQSRDGKDGADGGDKKNYQKTRFDFRCEECLKANKRFCSHCNKCGDGGHKRKDCPKN